MQTIVLAKPVVLDVLAKPIVLAMLAVLPFMPFMPFMPPLIIPPSKPLTWY